MNTAISARASCARLATRSIPWLPAPLRLLALGLLVVLLGLSSARAEDVPAPWEVVGSAPGFSAGRADYISLVLGPDGKPYVAYTDGADSNKATVMRLNAAGDGWEVVGGAGFSDGWADFISLAFGPDGKPYVAYRDDGNGEKATVMRLNAAGTGWEAVGGVGFSDGWAHYTSLAFGPDGKPYVAYQDGGHGGRATVTRLNAAGDGWEVVGSAGFSAGVAWYTSLAFGPDGRPYVAYRDLANGEKATVMRLNAAGNGWEAVGGAGFSTGGTWFTSLAFGPDGKPYVAYEDGANSDKATVMRLNAAGDGWEVVGNAGFSAGGTFNTSLAFGPDGKPYVAYVDWANGYKATVMRLNAAGTGWEAVGSAGFSAGATVFTSLAFGPDGKPYVAYVDWANSNKATVMSWTQSVLPTAPQPVTNVVASAGDGWATVRFDAPADNGGEPITGYTVTSVPGDIDCPVTVDPGSVQQSCTATGLSNGTTYTFSVVAHNAIGSSSAVSSNPVTPMAPEWPVTATASPVDGGTLSCDPNPVPQGERSTCTVSTNAGYVLDEVSSTCGGSLSGNTFTTDPITAACTVTARFLAEQTLTFPPQDPASHVFAAGGSFPINPPATSSNTGADAPPITYSSLTDGVCTVSGTTVTMVAPGTCTLAADQAGDANHTAAPQQSQSVALNAQTSFSGTTVSADPADAGPATASFTGGGANCRFDTARTAFIAAPAAPPTGRTLPQGMFAFTLIGCDASPVSMSITWPQAVGDYTKYGKASAGAADSYFAPDNLSVSGNTVSFTVQDGQKGDDDWTVNGEIVDPSGPMAAVGAVTAVSTLGQWSLLLLGLLAAGLGARRLQRGQ